MLVLDEFDRIADINTRRAVTDMIKAFSDDPVPAAIVVVGVADSVDSLIEAHQSIERCLVQIRMPRMSLSEMHQILDTGATKLGVTFSAPSNQQIVLLSQGLPHYTHLLALHSVRACVDSGAMEIETAHVEAATRKTVDEAQQSLRSAYWKAVTSPRKDSIYGQVLLACALSGDDEFGYFAAAGVRGPLSRVMGRPYEIPGFAKHLSHFCSPWSSCKGWWIAELKSRCWTASS